MGAQDTGGESDFYRSILHNAPWGAIVSATELEGPCEYINPEFTRITGYTLDDIPTVGDWIERAYPDPEYRAHVLGNWASDVDPENMRRDVVYRVACSDGSERLIQFRASQFGTTRMIVMLLDVTVAEEQAAERARLEARMHHKEKLESLGVLAAGVAHDFNNLGVGLVGKGDGGVWELGRGRAAHAKGERLGATARGAADLVSQLQAYTGEEVFAPQRIDLRDAVDEIRSLLETSVSKKAELRFRHADPVPEIQADPRQLRQVLVNLVSNASEALQGGSGTITVATGSQEVDVPEIETLVSDVELEPGLFAWVEVSDSGAGFDDAVRDRLFDPFYSTSATGSGLGLASVLGIVRAHRGAIRVRSTLGSGATFRVLLPTDEYQGEDGELDEDEVSSWIGRGTVLLVDDEAMVRDVARAMLERAGFDVLTAQDGYEAVEIFRDHGEDCCCVIVDLAMPRMNGEETYRELRTLRPDVRVVLTSGHEEREASSRFSGSGLAAFVQKPYTYTRLVDAVRRVLHGG